MILDPFVLEILKIIDFKRFWTKIRREKGRKPTCYPQKWHKTAQYPSDSSSIPVFSDSNRGNLVAFRSQNEFGSTEIRLQKYAVFTEATWQICAYKNMQKCPFWHCDPPTKICEKKGEQNTKKVKLWKQLSAICFFILKSKEETKKNSVILWEKNYKICAYKNMQFWRSWYRGKRLQKYAALHACRSKKTVKKSLFWRMFAHVQTSSPCGGKERWKTAKKTD